MPAFSKTESKTVLLVYFIEGSDAFATYGNPYVRYSFLSLDKQGKEKGIYSLRNLLRKFRGQFNWAAICDNTQQQTVLEEFRKGEDVPYVRPP